MSMGPSTVTLGTPTTVSIAGGNAFPNMRVDIAIDSWFIISIQSGLDGTYAASFTVESDGTVYGSPDTAPLGPGPASYQVTASSPDCACGEVAQATLTVEPAP
jgi:hypothetical protein